MGTVGLLSQRRCAAGKSEISLPPAQCAGIITNSRRKVECKKARVKPVTLYIKDSISILGHPSELSFDTDVVGHNIMKFVVTLKQDKAGFIIASCPALPGCHSQGRTRE